MRMIFHFAVLACLGFLSTPVLAEKAAPKASPMHYTKVRQEPKDSNSIFVKLKTVKKDEEKETEKAEEETPSTRIWNQYKALAAGEAEDEAGDNEKGKTEKKAEPEETAETTQKTEDIQKEPVAEPTGIASIISEYRKNRAQRSQMRSLTVTKQQPPAPAAPATAVEKKAE
ncbi:MAG: hypothetical protein WBK77_09235 [Alphaproteobacteria bacterium]